MYTVVMTRSRPARLAVCFERWPDDTEAVPADKRAKQVDAIGRMNFPLDCRSDGGLAAGVHKQVGGRTAEPGVVVSVGEGTAAAERLNLAQDRQRNNERVVGLDRGRALVVPQPLQKRVTDFRLPGEPLVLRHSMQGALEKTTQVVGNRNVRVGRLWRADIGSSGLKRRNEPLKLDCEKLLVQPGNQFGHSAPPAVLRRLLRPQPLRWPPC